MRLIDADALRGAYVNKMSEIYENVASMKNVEAETVSVLCGYSVIDEAPTVDAVQVVRCEECVYRRRCMLQHFVESNAVDSTKIDWSEWYCADGVRDISKSDERREKE